MKGIIYFFNEMKLPAIIIAAVVITGFILFLLTTLLTGGDYLNINK